MNRITETILYIKMRMEGVDLEPALEELVNEKEKQLEENIDSLRDRLINKQAQVEQVEKELLNDVVAIDIFEAPNFQKENLTEAINALKPVLLEQENKLTNSEQGLAKMQVHTALLTNELNGLTQQLRHAKGKYYSFQEPLEKLGQKISQYQQSGSKS